QAARLFPLEVHHLGGINDVGHSHMRRTQPRRYLEIVRLGLLELRVLWPADLWLKSDGHKSASVVRPSEMKRQQHEDTGSHNEAVDTAHTTSHLGRLLNGRYHDQARGPRQGQTDYGRMGAERAVKARGDSQPRAGSRMSPPAPGGAA